MTQDIRNIVDLINLAEINLAVCNYIQTKLQDEKYQIDGKYKFLILVSNNAFHQAIGIIHGLLCSTTKEDIKIKPVLEDVIKQESDIDLNTKDEDIAQKLLDQLLQDYPRIDYFSYSFLQVNEGELIGDRLSFLRKFKRQDNFLLEQLEKTKQAFENGNFHKIRHQTVAHKNKQLTDPAGAIRLLVHNGYFSKLEEIIVELKVTVSYFGFDYALENNDIDALDFLNNLLE